MRTKKELSITFVRYSPCFCNSQNGGEFICATAVSAVRRVNTITRREKTRLTEPWHSYRHLSVIRDPF